MNYSIFINFNKERKKKFFFNEIQNECWEILSKQENFWKISDCSEESSPIARWWIRWSVSLKLCLIWAIFRSFFLHFSMYAVLSSDLHLLRSIFCATGSSTTDPTDAAFLSTATYVSLCKHVYANMSSFVHWSNAITTSAASTSTSAASTSTSAAPTSTSTTSASWNPILPICMFTLLYSRMCSSNVISPTGGSYADSSTLRL